MIKTKIICTIGMATNSVASIKSLIKAGMNVARINMSHGTHQSQAEKIKMIKQAREELNAPVAIMLDTKGPEVRIKTFKNGAVVLKSGQNFTLHLDSQMEGDETGVAVGFDLLYKYLKADNLILADDGNITLRVKSVSKQKIETTVVHGGDLSNRKALNFPSINIEMEYLSKADKEDIEFGI
ncbi:MAG: pyruvate kinase, partial [Firmicutes bacterium]|nr:pyruvate kinase [Bacillota bacterium]